MQTKSIHRLLLGLALAAGLSATVLGPRPASAGFSATPSAPPSPPHAAQASGATVLAPGANPFGKSYGEWSAAWWQWEMSIPAATNPNLDTSGANCAQGQSGPVWFLAGTFGGSFSRSCTVPAGKALFLPVLTQIDGAAAFDCNRTLVVAAQQHASCDLNTLRSLAAASQDNPLDLEVSVDGQAIASISSYRFQSPVFRVTYPADNVLSAFGLTVPAGTYAPNVADGYYLMLAPLAAGAHTIHIKGVANNGFVSEVTYGISAA